MSEYFKFSEWHLAEPTLLVLSMQPCIADINDGTVCTMHALIYINAFILEVSTKIVHNVRRTSTHHNAKVLLAWPDPLGGLVSNLNPIQFTVCFFCIFMQNCRFILRQTQLLLILLVPRSDWEVWTLYNQMYLTTAWFPATCGPGRLHAAPASRGSKPAAVADR